MTDFPGGRLPTAVTTDGYFAWTNGTELYAGYDAGSMVLVASAVDGFSRFSYPVINDNHMVAFTGVRPDGSSGVFTRNMMGGPIVTMAETGSFFNCSSPQVGSVGFYGYLTSFQGGPRGIFVSDGKTIKTIVLFGDKCCGTPNACFSLNDLGDVAFTNQYNHLFVGNGSGPARLVYDQRDSEAPQINNSDAICFREALGEHSTYTLSPEGVESRVIGARLWGFDVVRAFQYRAFNNAGQVAMQLTLAGEYQVILRADPIP